MAKFINKDEVKSITVEYGGFFGGAERRTITHKDYTIVVERVFLNGAFDDGRDLYKGQTWESLIERLNAIGIEKWNEEYFDPYILDGTQWSLDIDYYCGKSKHYYGSNMYPENFALFMKVMEME